MKTSVFMDRAAKPDHAMLREALGQAFAYFTALADLTRGCQADWSFYKSSGWHQKIGGKKKALAYLIPLSGAFQVRMTIREGERALLLDNAEVRFAHEAMTNAKQYSEGLLLEFTVTDEASFQECSGFLSALLSLR